MMEHLDMKCLVDFSFSFSYRSSSHAYGFVVLSKFGRWKKALGSSQLVSILPNWIDMFHRLYVETMILS